MEMDGMPANEVAAEEQADMDEAVGGAMDDVFGGTPKEPSGEEAEPKQQSAEELKAEPTEAPDGEETEQAQPDEGSEEEQFMRELAAQAGMTPKQLMQNYEQIMQGMEVEAAEERQQADEQKVQDRIEQLMDQDFGEDMATYIAQLEMRNARLENDSEERQWQEAAYAEQQARMDGEINRLALEYPEALEGELADEVLEDVTAGYSPLEAYQRQQLQEKTEEVAKLEQKLKNKTQTPGGARGRGEEKRTPLAGAMMEVFGD